MQANPVQTTDARIKLLFSALLIFLTLNSGLFGFSALPFVFLLEALLFILLKTKRKTMLRRTLQIYPMILLITLPLPFRPLSAGDEILFHWHWIEVYVSGTARFIQTQIRLLLIFWALLIFILNTPAGQFIDMLERMRLPGWFIAVVRLTRHFIILTQTEFARLHLAFRARYSGNRKIVLIITAVQITSVYMMRLIARSEASYLALLSRGFSGTLPAQSTAKNVRSD